jgi:hypothetical protein
VVLGNLTNWEGIGENDKEQCGFPTFSLEGTRNSPGFRSYKWISLWSIKEKEQLLNKHDWLPSVFEYFPDAETA